MGVLLVIAGARYATDSIGAVVSRDPWTAIGSATLLGEFLLALWLIIRSRSIVVKASLCGLTA